MGIMKKLPNGRVDGVLEFTDKIYIIEFKFGKAKAAMAQIKDRSYSEPYLTSGKCVVILAIGFGKKKVEYLLEELVV